MSAIRIGLASGRIELRHVFTTPTELASFFLPGLVFMVVLTFLRSVPVSGGGLSYGALMLASMIGSGLLTMGMTLMTSSLAADREDGGLLRAKALPNGMTAYLIGKTVLVSGATLSTALIMLVYALLLFDVTPPGPGGWLVLVLVLLVGLVATLLIGAVLGALFPNPRVAAVISIPMLALTAISGILFPITVLPAWVQWIAQVFPMYWLGLGVRSSLLPDSALAVEIGHSWRTWETFGVLGAWVVLGLLLAPPVLRRMARRASGTTVSVQPEKAKLRSG
ncbi:ABC transporter permease [Kutzneria buriramensis]|uniref:ABC-2 type transport system permease protein n=1 Tax=Kutzneria buriramensis TaxID=1045776 RepID=A0A3E0HRJ0_9PSEU|nr:ABC transporter permease [Kutzneria buriramensis]REH48605.1 ABC-2 type transport system permease protein [Kutzneria buriramensis]